MFRNLRKSPEILGKCCDGFVNPGDEKTKLSDFELEKACQGSQIRQIWRILRQNCSDDSAEFTERVTSTPEIFCNKQGATLTPEIFGKKHSFVLIFFTTNTIYVNCKHCKP